MNQPLPAASLPAVERRSKVVTIKEAVSNLIPDGLPELAIGGMHMHNNPMAVLREIVRQKRRVKRLVTSPSAGVNADLLIGAGLVGEVVTSYIGFEHLGLSANFRRGVESGSLKLFEVDEPHLVYGLQAGAGGIPFIPYPPGLELSDLHRINPEYYNFTTDPYTGRRVMTARPIKPSVAVIHCQEADPYGNAIFRGSQFTDRQMALAAETVIVQVERVVPNEVAMTWPSGSTIPGFLVSAVVEAPFGCHPTASHTYYSFDEVVLRDYIKSGKTPESFDAYLQEHIYGTEDEAAYLCKVGGAARLESLVGGEAR